MRVRWQVLFAAMALGLVLLVVKATRSGPKEPLRTTATVERAVQAPAHPAIREASTQPAMMETRTKESPPQSAYVAELAPGSLLVDGHGLEAELAVELFGIRDRVPLSPAERAALEGSYARMRREQEAIEARMAFAKPRLDPGMTEIEIPAYRAQWLLDNWYAEVVQTVGAERGAAMQELLNRKLVRYGAGFGETAQQYRVTKRTDGRLDISHHFELPVSAGGGMYMNGHSVRANELGRFAFIGRFLD